MTTITCLGDGDHTLGRIRKALLVGQNRIPTTMKKIVILGGGTGGTIMANRFSKTLDPLEWSVTVIDKDPIHYYQPGFLFIPFGIYTPDEVMKLKVDFLPREVEFLQAEAKMIVPGENAVYLDDESKCEYDILVIATGAETVPEETPGLKEDLWYTSIFDFYTLEGARHLAKKLKTWEGGKLVISLAEPTIKCPVAPLEFAFLADAFFKEEGIRDHVDITYVTPLSGAFTKPKATQLLSSLLEEKKIKVVPDFYMERVDTARKLLVSYDNQEVPFDLLVSIPVNKGSKVIENSSMGDEDGLNFIPTDKYSLQSKNYKNIFVIGDATNVPASKAGSVVHFESEILIENILSYIQGKPMEAKFDGHANCFIETGGGKATLIDFNYDTEPLPGKFPWAGVGPMGLLKVNRANHLGKLAFRWVYWHMLLTGKKLPISSHMSMAGKMADDNHPPKSTGKVKNEEEEEILV
jgi:sulfide:quinone oxidoreductase